MLGRPVARQRIHDMRIVGVVLVERRVREIRWILRMPLVGVNVRCIFGLQNRRMNGIFIHVAVLSVS